MQRQRAWQLFASHRQSRNTDACEVREYVIIKPPSIEDLGEHQGEIRST